MHPNPRRVIPVIIVLGLIGLGWWYFSGRAAATPGGLTASGTIETTQVNVSPELGGRVESIKVDEGQTVKAGEVLVQFDTSLLGAQREQAQAGLAAAQAGELTARAMQDAAQAQLDQLVAGARPEQIAAAEAQYKAAQSAVGQAVANRDNIAKAPTNDRVAAAEAQLAQVQASRAQVENAYTQLSDHNVTGWMEEQTRAQVVAARQAEVAAQAQLDQVRAGASTELIQAAGGAIGVAAGQRDAAKAQLALLTAGATPQQLAAARAQLDAAKAQVQLAQAQVAAAQAALHLLDVQLSKLTLTAPVGGVVLARAIEPGEVASPGATLLVLGELDSLTITVYVPEDRYATISLGQSASVTGDSFPGQSFPATVTHIADQGEFTPRNVQTATGRKTTVFAIRLTVSDPQGRLKAGMPADVTFGS
jgi:multidrug resistance efflux pump